MGANHGSLTLLCHVHISEAHDFGYVWLRGYKPKAQVIQIL